MIGLARAVAARAMTRLHRTEPAMEAVYQTLVTRDLRRLEIADDFYAVASAANYSLLYLIIRIAERLQPKSVLDIGAGQTSILWSRLQQKGLVGNVLTLEHDRAWAETIQSRVGHEIRVSPLSRKKIGRVSARTYEWPNAEFDVVCCDGPVGERRRSRYGIILAVPLLAKDFVVIMDDSERGGEMETIAKLAKQLPPHKQGHVRALKRQTIFAGGDYSEVAYY